MENTMEIMERLEGLMKSLEAGNYNAAPSTLVQGSALQIEDMSGVMTNVTFQEKHLKLQKIIGTKSCKSLLAQWNRQLSYGSFGGSAQLEGAVGQEDDAAYVRVTVPMAFYSTIKRVTVQAMMVDTFDGKKADDREAENAAKKIAGDIEFDLFRGKDDFSNAGAFDGNPLAIPALPNMLGIGAQIRQSDEDNRAKDLMFAEYGSDLSVVIPVGGVMSQANIEDAYIRSVMNHGTAETLYVDPMCLSAYNKAMYADKQRILLGNTTAATMAGANFTKQATSGGEVKIETSRFLSAKRKPGQTRKGAPGAPTIGQVTYAQVTGGETPFLTTQTYTYYATACNERGESLPSNIVTATVSTDGYSITLPLSCTSGTVRYYNVYRSGVGGSAATAYFIGRVKANEAVANYATNFVDLGARQPAFMTGYLLQEDTFEMKELAPYSRLKLAVTDLSQPEAHFRFTCVAAIAPRFSVILDGLMGSY
jgi:hypothetical protein